MNMIKSEPCFIGTPVRITLKMALEMKRYDYIVKLIRRWRIEKCY